MYTIKETLDGVMNTNASRDPGTHHATHSDRCRYPTTLSEMLAGSSGVPAERRDTVSDSSEAAVALGETLSGSKNAPAIAPTTRAASKRAAESFPKSVAPPKRAAESFPKSVAPPRRAAESFRTSRSGSKKAPVSSSEILSNPEEASTSSPTIPCNPEKASAVAPAVLSNRRNASAGPVTVARRSPKPSSDLFERVHQSPEPSGDVFEHAYQALLPELHALRSSEVMPINIAITGAVTKALQIQPTLARLMDRMAEATPGLDPRLPARLVTHALALGHAHALFVTASQDVDALPSVREEGKKLRAVLLMLARALIQRGLVDPEPVRRLRADSGYHTLAFDLQVLAELLRPHLLSKTGLTLVSAAELERAQELALTILTLLGRRGRLRADIDAAADLRRRAFTLFVRVYNETRRAVVFLRWQEGDADQLIPLLHTKRKGRKKADDTSPANKTQ